MRIGATDSLCTVYIDYSYRMFPAADWTDWSVWGSCKCDETESRSRECATAECDGAGEESRDCTCSPLDLQGAYSWRRTEWYRRSHVLGLFILAKQSQSLLKKGWHRGKVYFPFRLHHSCIILSSFSGFSMFDVVGASSFHYSPSLVVCFSPLYSTILTTNLAAVVCVCVRKI